MPQRGSRGGARATMPGPLRTAAIATSNVRDEHPDPMPPVHEVEALRAPATTPGHTLPAGTRLREYEIKGLIGEGTCSIVYLGWDHALQRKVAIKEYMPAAMAGRLQGSASVIVASD